MVLESFLLLPTYFEKKWTTPRYISIRNQQKRSAIFEKHRSKRRRYFIKEAKRWLKKHQRIIPFLHPFYSKALSIIRDPKQRILILLILQEMGIDRAASRDYSPMMNQAVASLENAVEQLGCDISAGMLDKLAAEGNEEFMAGTTRSL